MANVKQVLISGVMPFNITDHDESTKWLGYLNAPSVGIRIEYGSSRYVPNPDGGNGQTAMYDFLISGEEAMTFDAFRDMTHDLTQGGAVIDRISILDIEDGHDHWDWSRP